MTTDHIPDARKKVPAVGAHVQRPVGRPAPERASICGLTECQGKPMCSTCVVMNTPAPKFRRGDLVRKRSGSQWQGRVVGEYSTALTPEGYAVESDAHAGSVQIYPAAALELVPA